MTVEEKKTRGRPRVFDIEDALEKALQVFWKRGYEGASISELTEALGINKPSLYTAFGNKEELFKKALAKYTSGQVAFVSEVVNEPTARKVAESFLEKAADALTNAKNPKGCMIVQGALSCGEEAKDIHRMLIMYRNAYEDLLRQRFERAKADGDLPSFVIAKDLAKFLAVLHQGMSVQATSGSSKEELLKISKLALNAWPS